MNVSLLSFLFLLFSQQKKDVVGGVFVFNSFSGCSEQPMGKSEKSCVTHDPSQPHLFCAAVSKKTKNEVLAYFCCFLLVFLVCVPRMIFCFFPQFVLSFFPSLFTVFGLSHRTELLSL